MTAIVIPLGLAWPDGTPLAGQIQVDELLDRAAEDICVVRRPPTIPLEFGGEASPAQPLDPGNPKSVGWTVVVADDDPSATESITTLLNGERLEASYWDRRAQQFRSDVLSVRSRPLPRRELFASEWASPTAFLRWRQGTPDMASEHEAGSLLRRGIELAPSVAPSLWVREAPSAVDGRPDAEEAVEAFRGAIDLCDDDVSPMAATLLGRLLEDVGRDLDAAEAYRVAIRLEHMDWSAYAMFALAELLSRTGHLDDAISLYQQVAETGHRQAAGRAAYTVGMHLRERGKRGDIDGARLAFEISAFTNHIGNWPVGSLRLGELLAIQGERDDAEAALRRAVASGTPMQHHTPPKS